MSYTTVVNVAAMFPSFTRGTPQQKPSDALIQTYIDDVAAEINAILVRRGFVAAGLGPPQIQLLLSQDAANICELINRYGAAAQLGQTLSAFGAAATKDLAASLDNSYQRMKADLDARDSRGQPRPSGPYDKYFDPLARTETAEPGLQAIAGGDQPEGQAPCDTGSSQVFGKFDKRGT